MKLANCTLHEQTSLKDEFASFGIEIGDEIMGFEVAISDTAEIIRLKAADVIDSVLCGDEGGILVGGLSSSTYYLITEAFKTRCEETPGLRVFEAITERIRDEKGRFIFVLKGVREILLLAEENYNGRRKMGSRWV